MSVADDKIRRFLLLEMIARVIKQLYREKMREKTREVEVPTIEPYRESIVELFNSVIRPGSFWNEMKTRLVHKFEGCLTEEEMVNNFDLSGDEILELLQNIQKITG